MTAYFLRRCVLFVLAFTIAGSLARAEELPIVVGQVYDYVGDADGGTYRGEMRVLRQNDDGELEGEIDIKVVTQNGRRYTVRQDFRLTQSNGHIDVRCFHPRAIEGSFKQYSSDRFSLDLVAPGVYKGSGADRIGQSGQAVLTLRTPAQ